MTDTSKQSANGVVRIKSDGVMRVQFGDDEPVVEFDAIGAWDEWHQTDASFRDAAGILPPDKYVQWNAARRTFVENLCVQAIQASGHAVKECHLTHAQTGEFMARLMDKVEELKVFFQPLRVGTPSSPQSTAVRFEQ